MRCTFDELQHRKNGSWLVSRFFKLAVVHSQSLLPRRSSTSGGNSRLFIVCFEEE